MSVMAGLRYHRASMDKETCEKFAVEVLLLRQEHERAYLHYCELCGEDPSFQMGYEISSTERVRFDKILRERGFLDEHNRLRMGHHHVLRSMVMPPHSVNKPGSPFVDDDPQPSAS